MQKYKYSEYSKNIFKKINDEPSAYAFGAILTDGNVSDKSNQITIEQKAEDKEFLENIKECMELENPIKPFDRWGKDYFRFIFCNKEIKKSLINHGAVPNKTYNHAPITGIYKHARRDFMRGVFDGDGCFTNGYFKITSHNITFLHQLAKMLQEDIDITPTIFSEKDSFSLFVIKIADLRKLYIYLYKDSTYYLTRKKEKFEKTLLLKKDTLPGSRKVRRISDGKIYSSIKEAAIDNNINNSTLSWRLKNGTTGKFEYVNMHDEDLIFF